MSVPISVETLLSPSTLNIVDLSLTYPLHYIHMKFCAGWWVWCTRGETDIPGVSAVCLQRPCHALPGRVPVTAADHQDSQALQSLSKLWLTHCCIQSLSCKVTSFFSIKNLFNKNDCLKIKLITFFPPRFLPPLAKQALDVTLENRGITKSIPLGDKELLCEVKDGVLRIGNTHAQVYEPDNSTKIPDTLFFDINQVKYFVCV